MRFHENEEAVSPVIGVILMVAITVILAAVIAVFVFGMAGEVQSTKSVAVSVKLQANATAGDNDVIITYQGGSDHNSVQYINWTATGSTCTFASPCSSSDPPAVGEKFIAVADNTAAGTIDVVVIAKFADGTQQVIYDQTL